MENIPNLLMVAGQQQNVGKTTLLCNLISHIRREQPVYAVKVTPHFHKNLDQAVQLTKRDHFEILVEKSYEGNKDTSRMLRAGAEKAYLLQAEGNGMLHGFLRLMEEIPAGAAIVCESAGLRENIVPGVFIMLRQLYCKICSIEDEKMFKLADRVVTYTVNGFDMAVSDLTFSHKQWNLV